MAEFNAGSQSSGVPIYDDPTFFENYMQLPRQIDGLNAAPEWPIMEDMIGDLNDTTVLDLGCGVGWFARHAVQHGAAHVDASDVSSRMVEQARQWSAGNREIDAKISYDIKDLNTAEFETGKYDIVHSSLALHYLPTNSYKAVIQRIQAALKPGGRLVFSCEHPIYTAPAHPDFLPASTLPASKDNEDLAPAPIWPLTHYAHEGIRKTSWMGGVTKYHRTVEGILGPVLEAGFTLKGVREFVARLEDLPAEWVNGASRPAFLIIHGVKEE